MPPARRRPMLPIHAANPFRPYLVAFFFFFFPCCGLWCGGGGGCGAVGCGVVVVVVVVWVDRRRWVAGFISGWLACGWVCG